MSTLDAKTPARALVQGAPTVPRWLWQAAWEKPGASVGGALVGSGRCLKGLGGFDGAAVDHAGLESTFRAMAAAP